MDEATLKARVEEVLKKARHPEGQSPTMIAETLQGTLGVLIAAYGPNSPQLETVRKAPSEPRGYPIWTACTGALQNLLSELQSGFTGSLRLSLTGAVLGDFVSLSRDLLGEKGEDAKNVAAVLAAAAFEDTMRRLARELAGVHDRPKLESVLQALRAGRHIEEAQFTIAQGYLKFRNDALHADWETLQRESVASVLGFLEQLILKHFS